ncbi:hypothetical protein EVAR_90443_1 [Eumeta japonica]|uniref:Uncharacterized protein n=1 Tax=Eumeta variegata TaxID=151549 RepID=A0A4C1SIA7_EUMVA|nr:hypothetical protein EVAR_90443_1 [Eumeta japonica]
MNGSSGCPDELETVCTAGWESVWDGIYRVIRNTGRNREDVLLINDSGQTCSPNESRRPLANTFSVTGDTDDPYHTELRRRTDGSVCPPEALDT